jgi:outer membrane protein assembly factor BamB
MLKYMKFHRSRVTPMTAIFMAMISIGCVAEDWPQWRGPNQDGKVSGFIAPDAWPDALTKMWSVEVGEGDASPALVDGKLYVFSMQYGKEIVRCLDAADGKEIWRNDYDSVKVTGVAAPHAGPRSSPAVGKGKVVTLGVGGVISCFDSANGDVVWRKEEFTNDLPRYHPAASPSILDDMCVVQLGGMKSGLIIAFGLDDGAERWRWEGERPGYASPVVMTIAGEKQIVALTHMNLIGLSPADGKMLWQTPFKSSLTSTNSITPVAAGQTVIIAAKLRGTHARRVEKTEAGYQVTESWSKRKVRMAFNTPVVNNGLLFGLSQSEKLFCLNVDSGEVMWKDTDRREQFGTLVDAGTVIFALPKDGMLTVFEPTGKRFNKLAEYHVSDTPTYSYPIVAGNKIIIQDQNAITLWTIK